MPTKKYNKARTSCQVTFALPKEVEAETAALCGDFNDWDETSHPMKRLAKGNFKVTVKLEPGTYRYRYLLDGERWENDWEAESYQGNAFGTEDSVVEV